jgi:hypothetical protein
MQSYGLRTGVHYCVANRVTTFLDVDADRYFGLPATCHEAFSYLTENGTALEVHTAGLAPLLDAKLIVPIKDGADFPRPVKVPDVRESVIDQIDTKPSLWGFLRAWNCQWAAERDLRRMPLSRVLANLGSRKPRGERSIVLPPEKVLASFFETSIVIQNHDQCLRRSVAMVNYLTQHACHPLFVIGVRNNPFEAHAWVQIQDIALNDHVEKIGRFTPILAI